MGILGLMGRLVGTVLYPFICDGMGWGERRWTERRGGGRRGDGVRVGERR
jgi:hypothetical protein